MLNIPQKDISIITNENLSFRFLSIARKMEEQRDGTSALAMENAMVTYPEN
jgi:hypothetical protein